MLYASSKSAIKVALGKKIEEYSGTSISDCSYAEYKKHISGEAPLSEMERSLR